MIDKVETLKEIYFYFTYFWRSITFLSTLVRTSGHGRVHATSTIDIFTRFQAGLRLGRPRRHRVGLAAEEEGAPLQLGPLRQHLSGQVSALCWRHAHRLHEQGRSGRGRQVIKAVCIHQFFSDLCRFGWPSSALPASAGPPRNSLSTAGRSTRPRSSGTRRTASSPAARTASSFTSTSGNLLPTTSF